MSTVTTAARMTRLGGLKVAAVTCTACGEEFTAPATSGRAPCPMCDSWTAFIIVPPTPKASAPSPTRRRK